MDSPIGELKQGMEICSAWEVGTSQDGIALVSASTAAKAPSAIAESGVVHWIVGLHKQ